MARLDCLNGTQRSLIEKALVYYEKPTEMADMAGVHPRTLRDWQLEKHRMPLEALRRIYENAKLPLPITLKTLPDLWHLRQAAQKGGRRRFQLYGPLGSLESRRKGGRISVQRFRDDPALAKALGFGLRKTIRHPRRSSLLAEFVGTLLGDGCLCSKYQVTISFNSKTDNAYSTHLQSLFERLFGIQAALLYRKETNTGVVVASSRSLCEYLIAKVGLRNGDKVVLQVDLPDWIWKRRTYQGACLRGLMDTDGSVYVYQHKVNGHFYRHRALCFTNHSIPLLRSAERLFRIHGFHPSVSRYNVYLHRDKEIREYFRKIGTSNPKHLGNFRMF